MVNMGYRKYYGSAFKLPTVSRWVVVVSGPDMIEDIRRAADDQLSFREAVAEIVQVDYMMGPQIRLDPYHVAVVRSALTRNFGVRFSDLVDEITTSFSDLVPVATEGWTKVPALKTSIKIVVRTSNRVFVGLPLCRDSGFRALAEQHPIDIITGSLTINMFPTFMRPIVGRFFTKIPSNIRRTISYVGPIIQERLDKEAEYGTDWPDKPNDLISWLLDEAKGYQRSIHDLAVRLLSINFAAIHTTSMAFTHVLYDLATHTEYAEPMRKEVKSVIQSEGWNKESIGKMRKLDSFIKESQRLGIGALQMRRRALKEFTFSNGVTVPVGTHIAVASHSTHMDKVNYKNPEEFHGFRFEELSQKDGDFTKYQAVSLSKDFILFGQGRNGCPGRFFAINELKVMLAYVLLTYDVKLPGDGRRPENSWFRGQCSPNRTAEVMFRKRDE